MFHVQYQICVGCVTSALGENDKAKMKWSSRISNTASWMFGDLTISAPAHMDYTSVLCALKFSWIMRDGGHTKNKVMAFSCWDHPSFPYQYPPPFSHHNIVLISPLRLNPSLPVRCGKRHFENEIGYINSCTITLAIAFPLYSSNETWLTSTTTHTFLTERNANVSGNMWDWPCLPV